MDSLTQAIDKISAKCIPYQIPARPAYNSYNYPKESVYREKSTPPRDPHRNYFVPEESSLSREATPKRGLKNHSVEKEV